MSSVEIIVREDAKGKAKRDKKGGRVVKHLILSDGLKRGADRDDVVELVREALA